MHHRRFHNRLKRYRRERGLSQKEVAKILGLKSSSMVSRWEHGECLPETLNALKMAALYRTAVDVIYEDLRMDLSGELSPRVDSVLRSKAEQEE
jgi:transcriptional regulator with XRE-family HTH domain